MSDDTARCRWCGVALAEQQHRLSLEAEEAAADAWWQELRDEGTGEDR
jgi:hypothetical protein